MKVLLLHGYSATNAGDGLLVEESITLIREVLGSAVEVTLLASRPETFSSYDDGPVYNSRPTLRGLSHEYLRTIRNIQQFDYVFGVGGGYLRAGTFIEGLKCALVHGPQLLAAGRVGERVAYLPQSVGPARGITAMVLRRALSRMALVCVRDDRSLSLLTARNAARFPDLALMSQEWVPRREAAISSQPILSVRESRGGVPAPVLDLAKRLGSFDGYVQSRGASNDDARAMQSLRPATVVTRAELLRTDGPRRVVIAMRLHAALMALAAGHYVVHLSYERKGFGAFADLDMQEYVHNVFRFSADDVLTQAESLLGKESARREYDQRIDDARLSLQAERTRLTNELRRALASGRPER